jgi:hypothetical protein
MVLTSDLKSDSNLPQSGKIDRLLWNFCLADKFIGIAV